MQWLSWDHLVKLLGVLGFVIGVCNSVAAVRNRTVNPQPELLAELRNYLDVALRSCQQVRLRLNFDRHQILTVGDRPDIPPRPTEFDDAIERMPELGSTITSIGQRQIGLLHVLIKGVSENWNNVTTCIDAKPMSVNALDFAQRLRRQCLIVEKFFPDYVDAITSINKGNLWKRYRYRDHRPIIYKIFRWTPLQQAVSEYERTLTES